jgi:hypothetical protein
VVVGVFRIRFRFSVVDAAVLDPSSSLPWDFFGAFFRPCERLPAALLATVASSVFVFFGFG